MVIVTIAQIPAIHQILLWDRSSILEGQWWRVITGNITHTNSTHLVMNLIGLAVFYALHGRHYSERLIVPIAWMMAAIGCVIFLSPFEWYAGLSGVLHGLFAWGGVRDIQNKTPLGRLLLVGLAIKLVFESCNSSVGFTEELINANVAYQAHLTGALVGLVCALCDKPKKARRAIC
jgi:Uncharacterized membrane protein (homolog of Drosophila rhomboid)